MSVIGMVILTVGALAAIFGLCALVIWLQKEYPGERYDERQKIARGEGYGMAFWTGLVYYIVVLIVIGFEDLDSHASVSLITTGILIQAMVLHFYGFLTHSAMPLGEKPMVSIVCWTITGIMYLVQYFALGGAREGVWFTFVYGCCFLTMALLHLINHLRRDKE